VSYKPVLIHVDPEDWEVFKEIAGNYRVSRKVREMVRREIQQFTREETKAQSFAGLTEG
jgi:hypothetical protein